MTKREQMQGTNDAGAPGAGTVVKKLMPGVPGTLRLSERYGSALVCVRYREDSQRGQRLTTVELIVDTRSTAGGEAFVRVAYEEADLRRKVREAGGQWDARRKLWRLPRPAIRTLKLASRVVKENA